MTLTEERSTVKTQPAPVASETTGIERLFGVGDHKPVGRLWMAVGSFLLVDALLLTFLTAIEAIDFATLDVLRTSDRYVQVGSLGRELLLFGGLVPILVGMAIYIVPLQVGASSLAFPRGAAAAFWSWIVGWFLVIAAYFANGGAGGGRNDFVELWLVSLGIVVASIMWALVCVASTILGARATGMTLARVPATSWSFLVFSVIGIVTLPVLLAELVISYLRVGAGFVEDTATLAHVINSVQLAPALYWLAIPVLGVIVDAIGVSRGSSARFHRLILAAIAMFGVVSFGVGVVGFGTVRDISYNNTFFVALIFGAVASVLAVLGLAGPSLDFPEELSSSKNGPRKKSASSLAGLLGGLTLLIGVAVSVVSSFEPITVFLGQEFPESFKDLNTTVVQGTTFAEGVRGAIFGAVLLALIAGANTWSAKIWGRYLNQAILSLASLAAFGGAVAWTVGGVGAGIDDQEAFPILEQTGGSQTELFSLIYTVGVGGLLVSAVLFLFALVAASVAGVPDSSPRTRWSGLTLEWATASPPPVGNFETPPVVASATPLADELTASSTEGSE